MRYISYIFVLMNMFILSKNGLSEDNSWEYNFILNKGDYLFVGLEEKISYEKSIDLGLRPLYKMQVVANEKIAYKLKLDNRNSVVDEKKCNILQIVDEYRVINSKIFESNVYSTSVREIVQRLDEADLEKKHAETVDHVPDLEFRNNVMIFKVPYVIINDEIRSIIIAVARNISDFERTIEISKKYIVFDWHKKYHEVDVPTMSPSQIEKEKDLNK